MRLTQTTIVVLCHMKLLLVFQNNINPLDDKKDWNIYDLELYFIWYYHLIISNHHWVICITPSQDAISFSWKTCKVYKCQYSFPFLHQSWIVGWWNFSLSQCVCNNFVQDICFLIDFLLEINKMIFVLYPLEVGQLLFKNSKETNYF